MNSEKLKEVISDNIDKSGAKRTLKTWLVGALLLIAATFFLGSWVEGRIDRITYEHDANMVATVEGVAPDAVEDVIQGLKASYTDEKIARGKEILQANGYEGSEDRVGVRTIFTVFMLIVILLRSLRFTQTIKKLFTRKKDRHSEMPEKMEKIAVREVMGDMVHTVKDPIDQANLMAESLLDREIDKGQYEKFREKLIKYVNIVNTMVRSFNNYIQIDERLGDTAIERCSLGEIIDQNYTSAAMKNRGISVSPSGDRGQVISTDIAFLHEAVGLVINCAIKHAHKESVIYLVARKNGNMTMITIRCAEKNIAKRWWRVIRRFLKDDGLLNAGVSADLLSADAIIHRLGGTLSAPEDGEYEIELPDM